MAVVAAPGAAAIPAAAPREVPPFEARWTAPCGRPVAEADRIPWGYGYSRLLLLPVDPSGCYAAWEIVEDGVQAVYRERRLDEGRVRWVLRFYDVTCIRWDGFNHHGTFDVGIDRGMRNWYVPLWSAEKGYVADLGFACPDGAFVSIARSNAMETPRSGPSALEFAEWGEPDGRGGIRRLAEEPDDRGRIDAGFRPARRPALGAPSPEPVRMRLEEDLASILEPILAPNLEPPFEPLVLSLIGPAAGFVPAAVGAAPPRTAAAVVRAIALRLAASPGPLSFFFELERLLSRIVASLHPSVRRRISARLIDWADRAWRPIVRYAGPAEAALPSSPGPGSKTAGIGRPVPFASSWLR